jgi:hypothetical protein
MPIIFAVFVSAAILSAGGTDAFSQNAVPPHRQQSSAETVPSTPQLFSPNLFTEEPKLQFTASGKDSNVLSGESEEKKRPPKFWKIKSDVNYIPSGGSGLGMTRCNLGASVMLPGLHLPCMNERSLVGIGTAFTYTAFDWKRDTVFPKQAYKAGFDFMLIQPFNKQWSFMGTAMPQWSSDGKTSSRSVNCSAMFGLRYKPNSRWELMFGAMYLGENSDIPVLPFGGLVYHPDENWQVDLMIPQVKVSRRFCVDSRLREHWCYIGSGFNGGSWAVQSENGRDDVAMYQEFNVTGGYKVVRKNLYSCCLEAGYVFGRKMKFDKHTQSTCRPDGAFMLQAKFEF